MRKVCLIAIWLCVIVLTCGCLSANAELASDDEEKRCLIIGMNTGLPNDNARNYPSLKRNWTAAMQIIVPYLIQHGHMDEIVIDHISQSFQKKAAIMYPIATDEDLRKAISDIVEQPYKSIDKLSSYPQYFQNFVSVLAEQVQAVDGNADVWLLEGRDPLYIEGEASAGNKAQRKSAEILVTLLQDYPALRIHFLYIHSEANPLGDVETEAGVRLDEMLRGNVEHGADRVCTWDIDAEAMSSMDGIAAAVQVYARQLGISYQVGDTFALQMQEEQEGRYAASYVHAPWMGASTAIVYVQSDRQLESLTLLDEEGTEITSVSVTLLQDAAVLLAPELAAGTYMLQAGATDGATISAIPVVAVPADVRQVQLKLANEGATWLRDDQEIYISTDALDIPAAMWTPVLLADGEKIDMLFDAPVMDEGNYIWRGVVPGHILSEGELHLQAELSMAYPNCVLLRSAVTTVEVANRPAEARSADALKSIRVLTGVPNRNSNEEIIMLTDLFMDADGDALTFEVLECVELNGEETNVLYTLQTINDGAILAIELSDGTVDPQTNDEEAAGIQPLLFASEYMSAAFTGDAIRYQPFAGHHRAYQFAVRARDDYGVWTDPVMITFEHIDLPAYLQTLRMGYAETVDENGYLHVYANDTRSICLLVDDAEALTILRQAIDEYQLPELAIPMTYVMQGQSLSGIIGAISTEGEERLGMEITLPLVKKSDQYAISFTKDAVYADIALPDLLADVELSGVVVKNLPPQLLTEPWAESVEGELKDFFNKENVTLSLSEILGVESPIHLRYDDENVHELTYVINLAGEGAAAVDANGKELPELRPNEYLLRCDAQGEAVFDVLFAAKGQFNLTIHASDGEYTSEIQGIQIQIESENSRLLTLITAITAVVVITVVAIIVVLMVRKPRFGDLYMGVCVCEDNAELYKPEAVMPLGFYGKKSTTLLSVALALQQPLVKGLDAAVLGSITLSPSRKRGVYVVLTFGKISQQLGVVGVREVTGVTKSLEVGSDDMTMVSETGSCIRLVFSHQANLF